MKRRREKERRECERESSQICTAESPLDSKQTTTILFRVVEGQPSSLRGKREGEAKPRSFAISLTTTSPSSLHSSDSSEALR